MGAYSEEYLNDVVENQGKLFDLVAQNYPNADTENFIVCWRCCAIRNCLKIFV